MLAIEHFFRIFFLFACYFFCIFFGFFFHFFSYFFSTFCFCAVWFLFWNVFCFPFICRERCYNTPLLPQAMQEVRSCIAKHLPHGVKEDGITLDGVNFFFFLFLFGWTVSRISQASPFISDVFFKFLSFLSRIFIFEHDVCTSWPAGSDLDRAAKIRLWRRSGAVRVISSSQVNPNHHHFLWFCYSYECIQRWLSFSKLHFNFWKDWWIISFDWLIDWSFDWLVDWSIDWLIDWSFDSIDWSSLIGPLIGWLVSWLIGWLVLRLIDWLIHS